MENYNSMVESEVRNKVKYDILRMLEIKCQKLFGFVPDDLQITFKPLRMLTAEEEENVKTQKFNRLIQAWEAGAISAEKFVEGCNKDNVFSVKLDPMDIQINPANPEQGDVTQEGANDPASPEDIDDPGANREDTRKTRAWDYSEIDAPYEEHKDPARVKSDKPPRGDEAKESAPAKPQPSRPKRNAIALPKPWTRAQLIARAFRGPSQYDMAQYSAWGGDSWITKNALDRIMNPGHVDEALWKKAKDASQKAFGEIKWPFVTWWYRKRGGKFK